MEWRDYEVESIDQLLIQIAVYLRVFDYVDINR